MNTKILDLDIGGMTCAACVGRVERGLKKVEGVESAVVNLATERATVTLVVSAQGAVVSGEEMLRLAAAAEASSEHPLARASGRRGGGG